MKTRYLFGVLAAVLLIQLSACSGIPKRHWPAIEGQVLDKDTGRPIEGALVIALWRGVGAYTTSMCFHVETVSTDANGNFHVPAWRNPDSTAYINQQHVELAAYKAGYNYVHEFRNNIHYLKKFNGSSSERIANLRSYSRLVSCIIDDDGSEKNLNVIDRALYEEAAKVAVTTEDKAEVLYFLMMVELYEVGPEESYKRESKRLRELKQMEQGNDK